jgi:hypothetical protein
MKPAKPDLKKLVPVYTNPIRQATCEALLEGVTKDLPAHYLQDMCQKMDAEVRGMGGGGSTGDSDAGAGDQSQLGNRNPIETAVELEALILTRSTNEA